jgi:hypothetical protein
MNKITPDRALFLRSYWEAIEELENAEQKVEMFMAIINYQSTGKIPNFEDTVLKVMWKLILPNVDNSIDKYLSSIENGKKGGRPKKTQNNPIKPKETQDNLIKAKERVGAFWETQEKLKKEKEKEKENKKENKIEKETENEIEEILKLKGIFS